MTSFSEFLVNTQPHIRNGSFSVIVRDLNKNVIVNRFQGDRLMRPQTMQVLDDGHLVIGYSLVRPFYFDFIDTEGRVYNKLELDADKCWILSNGLVVEVVGKQTIVKQVLPDFKAPHVVQVYQFAANWVDMLDKNVLVAQKCDPVSTLCFLDLTSNVIRREFPIFVTHLYLNQCILYGTNPHGEFVMRICLANAMEHGFLRSECVYVAVPKRKSNDISLVSINDRYMIYRNDQKLNSTLHLIDWVKRESIWSNVQDIRVVATSPVGSFVYCDQSTNTYFHISCGCSVSKPLPMLTGLKAKGLSKFMSDGKFVFHGEKRILVVDIASSTVLAQYDLTRHICDLMTVSKCDYKVKPKPDEQEIADMQQLVVSPPVVVPPSAVVSPSVVVPPSAVVVEASVVVPPPVVVEASAIVPPPVVVSPSVVIPPPVVVETSAKVEEDAKALIVPTISTQIEQGYCTIM